MEDVVVELHLSGILGSLIKLWSFLKLVCSGFVVASMGTTSGSKHFALCEVSRTIWWAIVDISGYYVDVTTLLQQRLTP